MGIGEPLVNTLSFKSMRRGKERYSFTAVSHMTLVQGKHSAPINLKLQHKPPPPQKKKKQAYSNSCYINYLFM